MLLPAALPHIVTGLRVGIAIALIVGISSEMIMSAEGLGRRVLYAQRMLQIPDLYAGILTLATVGYLLNHGASCWRPTPPLASARERQNLGLTAEIRTPFVDPG